VFGLFKIKALLVGMLLASPPVAAWILRDAEPVPRDPSNAPVFAQVEAAPMHIPVEILAKGSPSEVVYVEIYPQAVPEPGVPVLMALSSLLLLHRKRPLGK
jgi:hypothetical protein